MLVMVGLTCQGPLGKNVFLDPGFTANPAPSALSASSTLNAAGPSQPDQYAG